MKPLRLIPAHEVEEELNLCADCCFSELETCDHKDKHRVIVTAKGFYLASDCELYEEACFYCNRHRCKCDDWKGDRE